ncbi:receptor-like cytosolic serine/threonine-protein kinase RBK2 [Tripterygium wilfordii]|uniref:Receptor-like cytosolic serine/threonine-protein kinase RBK2 n=1 Tax=Tripterygium wilfordii TaxID=458696 RepID=A0A7J7CXX8_TRIWF|nr:receptor-like cytosolic serine/threonine-protein kinase RBK2 [Tripterygium wilfordii]
MGWGKFHGPQSKTPKKEKKLRLATEKAGGRESISRSTVSVSSRNFFLRLLFPIVICMRCHLFPVPSAYCSADGTAEGLLHLHEGFQSRIIHLDIKAANILSLRCT